MAIKALKSMWEQEKGREVGLIQSKGKKHWCEGGLTFTSCWQRDRSGSSLWSSSGPSDWAEGWGREVCMVGIVNHVCSVLARSGVDYVCQARASLAVWEGLGIVLAQVVRRWWDFVICHTWIFNNEAIQDTKCVKFGSISGRGGKQARSFHCLKSRRNVPDHEY